MYGSGGDPFGSGHPPRSRPQTVGYQANSYQNPDLHSATNLANEANYTATNVLNTMASQRGQILNAGEYARDTVDLTKLAKVQVRAWHWDRQIKERHNDAS